MRPLRRETSWGGGDPHQHTTQFHERQGGRSPRSLTCHLCEGERSSFVRCPINAGGDLHFVSCRGKCECIIS